MIAYENPLEKRQPIHNHTQRKHIVVTERSIIYEHNEKILLRHVYNALADHDMLAKARVTDDDAQQKGTKSYTVQVYGEDLNFRFEKQVMFANRDDVQKLLDILKKKVGKERMRIIKYAIGEYGPCDDLNRMAFEMRKEWKEKWPL